MATSSRKFDSIDLNHLKISPYYIGKLTVNIIDLLHLKTNEKDILLWKDRIRYIDKHKSDFTSDEEFKKHVEAIPDIVQNPDYVGIHPKGESIEFIKKIDRLMLVAVRLNLKSDVLKFRSAYPIKQSQLESYLKNGRTKKVQ
ncbi:PBECR2 nuclease fold domain-containing protein [Sporolactobacillus sp. CQH2019]|uniref:PBECR3 domain-containing polyvalent protein n=1 Tax=Sporolactobacillus sp. CQH2019 TaxID=3023512 RepID=UPI002368E25C|nr:PBECR2 nuclease fold domain-containing protein [Sporolactobacillus sp. CQH2019]MDD9147359.1 PBECR2 nuclease fold domain-containing protein [Sporolactobacillus sp. CQH2019]